MEIIAENMDFPHEATRLPFSDPIKFLKLLQVPHHYNNNMIVRTDFNINQWRKILKKTFSRKPKPLSFRCTRIKNIMVI